MAFEPTIDELTEAIIKESSQAKHLLREAGFGWTGLGLLETVKLCLEEVETLRSDRLDIRDYE